MCIHNENIDIHNWSMAIHNWNKDFHNWNINFHNWILDVHNWIMDTHNWIIKSPGIPGVTLCFCAGSYRSIFVLTLTLNWIFKVKYGICYNAATNGLMAMKRKANIVCNLGLKRDNEIWPWPWPWPKIFPVKYEICHTSSPQPNMVQLPWNEKQTFRLNSNQQMQSSGLTLAMTLTLNWTIGGHSWPWPWLFCDQDEV